MHKRILLPSNNKNEILYVSETIIDEDFKATQHSHPNLEIIFFTEGEGEVVTLSKKIKVKKNDLMIINSNSRHFETSKTNCKFFAIGINNLDAYLQKTFSKKIIYSSLGASQAKTINNLYMLIYQEASNKKSNYLDMINNYFENLKIAINRCIDLNFNKNNTVQQNNLVATICTIIENYFYSNIRLQDLAKRLSVSESLMCHDFKKEMGMSIMDYKIKCQIEEAKNLLTITDMSIIEISTAVGFNNSSYFSKTFKRLTTLSPKEYRCTFKN